MNNKQYIKYVLEVATQEYKGNIQEFFLNYNEQVGK